jgi:D-xylose transport system substrate-binding protein
VYAANDGTAAGAIAALKGAGFAPLPPVTGQDAELAGVQRILAGEQAATVFKAFKPETTIAAEMAITAATGVQYRGMPTQAVSNGSVDVPSVLLEPIAVTRETSPGSSSPGASTPPGRSAPPSIARHASGPASPEERGPT